MKGSEEVVSIYKCTIQKRKTPKACSNDEGPRISPSGNPLLSSSNPCCKPVMKPVTLTKPSGNPRPSAPSLNPEAPTP